MKTENFLNRSFKALKNLFQPKTQRIVLEKPEPTPIIPVHHTPEKETYHYPPCSGIPKDFNRDRKAKLRMQKLSRIINREK